MLCFNYTVGFPIVRNSSKAVVCRPPEAAAGAAVTTAPAAPAHRAPPGPRPEAQARQRAARRRQKGAARWAQPLEPILIPKLRIYFADFPYLHCSIN